MNKKTNVKVKICVPVIARTDAEIRTMMKKAEASHADIIEWRVDYYEHVNEIEHVIEMLKEIKTIIKDKELIFSCRSERENGNIAFRSPEYMLLCKTAILTKLIDYIDVEFLLGDTIVNNIVKHARIGHTKVLMSNYDYNSTPRHEIIENRLQLMFEKGADIAMVVCTPRNEDDVEELIRAGKEVSKQYDNIVLVSLKEMGERTRLHPELLGSCMTFASLDGVVTAPGQVDVEEVYNIINK